MIEKEKSSDLTLGHDREDVDAILVPFDFGWRIRSELAGESNVPAHCNCRDIL